MTRGKEKVVLIGTGAQAKYALETLTLRDDNEIVGVYGLGAPGDEPEWLRAYGARFLGSWDQAHPCPASLANRFLACCADADLKGRIFKQAESSGLQATNAIHPAASIAMTARVADGAIVNAGAVVQPFAVIGRGVMLHANTVVEHDCVLGDFVNLAPGARLAGWVKLGCGVTVFVGASIIPQIEIGARSVVGAGAVVIRNVPEDCTVAGVPARRIARRAAS